MVEHLGVKMAEIKKEENEKTVKIVSITDIKATRSKEVLKWVAEYDTVVLRMKAGDVILTPISYS